MLTVLDLFSCVGCHALGMQRAGLRTAAFVEANAFRRSILRARFPETPIYDDVRTIEVWPGMAGIIFGGPPCQRTSVAAAVHGYRSGESLWPDMLRICDVVRGEWVVVEQPPGNREWETEVDRGLRSIGLHTARAEFSARDCGAPYIRRRVYIIASPSLSGLEIAWSAIPSEVDRAKRAADAGGAWDAGQLGALRVDARSAGEMDRSRSRARRERIEALGDSNPPIMAEVIGRAIVVAERALAAGAGRYVTTPSPT